MSSRVLPLGVSLRTGPMYPEKKYESKINKNPAPTHPSFCKHTPTHSETHCQDFYPFMLIACLHRSPSHLTSQRASRQPGSPPHLHPPHAHSHIVYQRGGNTVGPKRNRRPAPGQIRGSVSRTSMPSTVTRSSGRSTQFISTGRPLTCTCPWQGRECDELTKLQTK